MGHFGAPSTVFGGDSLRLQDMEFAHQSFSRSRLGEVEEDNW